MAFLANFINTSNRGIMSGILIIAINELLLPAFDAMAEIRVNVLENPNEPSNKQIVNCHISCTGLPMTPRYKTNPINERRLTNNEL